MAGASRSEKIMTVGEILTESTNEPSGTVFYLVGATTKARSAIAGLTASELHSLVPTKDGGTALRVTFPEKDQIESTPEANGGNGLRAPPWGRRHLLQIGNAPDNDIVVDDVNASQCNFRFNGTTGELLLCDTLPNRSQLVQQMHDKRTRQPHNIHTGEKPICAVVLRPEPNLKTERSYYLKMSEEICFNLYPPLTYTEIPVQNKSSLFADQSLIETKWPGPKGNFVEFTKIETLGAGAEGQIILVVVHNTGAHFALKVHTFRPNAQKTVAERIGQTEKQMNVLKCQGTEVEKFNIVPCLHYQFSEAETVQIFMPVYWCSLQDLINEGEFDDPRTAKYRALRMLRDISSALCFLDSLPEKIVHRDVKPANILYRGEAFYLADFGVAKVVDGLHTNVGTSFFKAPEVQNADEHTPAMDVFSLGLTLANCLGGKPLGSPSVAAETANGTKKRYTTKRTPSDWAHEARQILEHPDRAGLGPVVPKMLQEDADDRPTAQEVKAHIDKYLRCYEQENGNGEMPTEEASRRRVSLYTADELQPTVMPAQTSPQPNIRSDTSSLVLPAVPTRDQWFHLTVNCIPADLKAASDAGAVQVAAGTLAPPAHVSSNGSSCDGKPPSSYRPSKSGRIASRIRAGVKRLTSRPKREKNK